jgi:hypothetical protein
MNDTNDSAEQRSSARRGYDPLVAGISEGVAAGYEALEYVVEGLRESLPHTGSTHAGAGGHKGAGGRRTRSGHGPAGRGVGAPYDLVDDVAIILADILEGAGEVAREVAESIRERRGAPPRPGVPELELKAAPGERAVVDFRISNTSSKSLKGVQLIAAPLIGSGRPIPADDVTFEPREIDRIGPNRAATVKVIVAVPPDTSPGRYRGLIQAEPGGAHAVLELRVIPPKVAGTTTPEAAAAAETATAA